MLFDLQGKRRRVVQVTYLGLAVLMGGGLVLFGIGSGASGGVFDIFSGGGGDSGNEIVEERIDKNEERAKANPQAANPHKELVRDYYALAIAQASDQGVFPPDAQDELRKAGNNWNTYVKLAKGNPDTSLARVALQVYDVSALNQPQEAVKVARVLAAEENSASSYLQVYQYAVLAKDERMKRLARQKALSLVPEKKKNALREQIDQLRGAIIAQQIERGDIDIKGITPKSNSKGGGGQTQEGQ